MTAPSRTDDTAADADAAPRSRRRWWSRLVGWGVSAAILVASGAAILGRWGDVDDLGTLLEPPVVAAVVALNVVGNAVLATAWRALVGLLGRRVPWWPAAYLWQLSQLARLTFTAATVGARAVLARRIGLEPSVSAGTTVVEFVWMAAVAPFLVLATAPWWLPRGGDYAWIAWASAVPLAALVVGVAAPGAAVRLLRRTIERTPLARFRDGVLVRGAAALRLDRADALRITGLFALSIGIRLAAFLVVLLGPGRSFATIGLLAVGAFALGQLAGWLAVFAPGGIGPREGVTAAVLAPAVGGGTALVVVAVVRLAELVAELVFLGITAVGARRARSGDG